MEEKEVIHIIYVKSEDDMSTYVRRFCHSASFTSVGILLGDAELYLPDFYVRHKTLKELFQDNNIITIYKRKYIGNKGDEIVDKCRNNDLSCFIGSAFEEVFFRLHGIERSRKNGDFISYLEIESKDLEADAETVNPSVREEPTINIDSKVDVFPLVYSQVIRKLIETTIEETTPHILDMPSAIINFKNGIWPVFELNKFIKYVNHTTVPSPHMPEDPSNLKVMLVPALTEKYEILIKNPGERIIEFDLSSNFDNIMTEDLHVVRNWLLQQKRTPKEERLFERIQVILSKRC